MNIDWSEVLESQNLQGSKIKYQKKEEAGVKWVSENKNAWGY